MRVLVTGGAGYIGSHTVLQLLGMGHEAVVVDNFSNAKRSVLRRVETISGRAVRVHEVDLTHRDGIRAVLSTEQPDAVIHFAGYKSVAESVADPLAYYQNNVGGALGLFLGMQECGPRRLVFSSSATVYGPDAPSPLVETLSRSANNPYGRTKAMIERVLDDVGRADSSWRVAVLRYFNPAGAHSSGLVGEDPRGVPNNLMPYATQVAVGRRQRVLVFGNDYDTRDGTGVRDYIHVEDLAAGHLAALRRLDRMPGLVGTWNLGTGRGTSVLELIGAFGRAVGRDLPYEVVGRRPGDMATSVADPTAAQTELGWRATRGLDAMCEDALRWQRANPDGYPDDD